IRWAVGLARDFPGHREISLNYNFKIWLADLLVFRKWRKALGGKVEGVMVGAAALRQDLCRMFAAAKIPVREGYGLTETSPVVSFNRFEPGGVRFGTVGIPVPGVEVKIEDADENGAGEIWVKGPNVMMGYFKKPEETAAAITPDGWLKTGDVGRFVEKKFLEITDRKKDIFKTSDGKYVSPQRLETQLKSSPFIEQCLVTGYRRPFVAALLAPNFTVLRQWCEVNKVHWTSPQFMVINPKVEKKMQAEIDRLNEGLSNHERIRKFTLLHESWSAESGELSSTLKNRRPVLEERFREEIEKMYK
ncbi:MAG TPA: AMP-binding protein, partial [Saprospiraceae bacterium]|nr:AMP-binding protein [Saprospiraceae bacterium]